MGKLAGLTIALLAMTVILAACEADDVATAAGTVPLGESYVTDDS